MPHRIDNYLDFENSLNVKFENMITGLNKNDAVAAAISLNDKCVKEIKKRLAEHKQHIQAFEIMGMDPDQCMYSISSLINEIEFHELLISELNSGMRHIIYYGIINQFAKAIHELDDIKHGKLSTAPIAYPEEIFVIRATLFVCRHMLKLKYFLNNKNDIKKISYLCNYYISKYGNE